MSKAYRSETRAKREGAGIKPEPKKKVGRIQVRAVKAGYFDHQRRFAGDVFFISDMSEFSDANATTKKIEVVEGDKKVMKELPYAGGWMELVDADGVASESHHEESKEENISDDMSVI